MNGNENNILISTQSILPKTMKIGRSEYVIEQHFTDNRRITDALYELIRIEDTLKDSENAKKSS